MSLEKLKIDSAIIVEGKYDKIKLSGIVDALIIQTNGFRIFKDKALINMLKMVAEEKGIIVLTDSDSAGMMIRSYIKNTVGTDNVKNVFLPKISGKEKRKTSPSAEGFVGVEGTPDEVIINALKNLGDTVVQCENDNPITKVDLFNLGFSGGELSSKKRASFELFLGLPDNLTANYLLDYLNFTFTKDEFFEVVEKWLSQTQQS